MTRLGQALPEPHKGLNFMVFSPNLHVKEKEQKLLRIIFSDSQPNENDTL